MNKKTITPLVLLMVAVAVALTVFGLTAWTMTRHSISPVAEQTPHALYHRAVVNAMTIAPDDILPLSEFLIKKNAVVDVEFTLTTEEFLAWLDTDR